VVTPLGLQPGGVAAPFPVQGNLASRNGPGLRPWAVSRPYEDAPEPVLWDSAYAVSRRRNSIPGMPVKVVRSSSGRSLVSIRKST
jgi:hypothetical protein